jgi:DNA (cytosine-5)-methyltransferase 1
VSGLIIDSFAGGGGASEGIRRALGRGPDIAINHDPRAIAMHKANHPETRHYCENIWEVDPREACGSNAVEFAWFSPDCTHFSRAKGTTPVKKEIRGLAWVVIRWAKAVRPRVIVLENVEEFQTWGPLLGDRPDKGRAGETFRAWLAQLSGLGYRIEFRSLVAADYGAPTTRRRLYLIARRDDSAIIWPDATHGKGRAFEWRPAFGIIDWTIPCPSIFERKRPHAEATLRRLVKGIDRYVLKAARPFIMPVKSWGGGGNDPRSIEAPMRTITASKRGEFAVVDPFIVRHGHYSTITGAGLIEGRGAGTFRGQPLSHPLATVCATNDKHLVAPIITKHYGGPNGHPTPGSSIEAPLSAVTARDHHAITAAFLSKFYGTSTGADLRDPLPTVTGQGQHLAHVQALLERFAETPAGNDPQLSLLDTMSHGRRGLVVIDGALWEITDIGMRMLVPRELYRAQDFPDSYIIDIEFNGKRLSKEAQTRMAGNSVSPAVACALARAAVPELERFAA